MSDTSTATAYLRTKVMTASPEQLRMMLLEGAARFARQARDGLTAKDYEKSYSGFTQCRAIISELMNTVRVDLDPDLGNRVRALYSFLYSELFEASMAKDVAKLDKVIELIDYEVETWGMLMDKLSQERGATPAVARPDAPTGGLSFQA